MTDRQLHASNLQFTNWKDQEIGEVTQVLDPGVDESDECIVAYPAGEIPGVELTVGDIYEYSFVEYPKNKRPCISERLCVNERPSVHERETVSQRDLRDEWFGSGQL